MKKNAFNLSVFIFIFLLVTPQLNAQKNLIGSKSINATDLESHLSFIASPLLKGRENGSEGLDVAAQYIASQSKFIGLNPANGNSYFQNYTMIKKSVDPEKTFIQVTGEGKATATFKERIYQYVPRDASDFEIEGEVVFAGYGIKSDKYKYNDFDNLTTEGKIVLIMNRAPLSEDGKSGKFDEVQWLTYNSIALKTQTLMKSGAKAILMVIDPKSGFSSFEEQFPTRNLKTTFAMKGLKSQPVDNSGTPKIIFIHRKVADELLNGTGHTLSELQNTIDKTLKPQSFPITGKTVRIVETALNEEKVSQNVSGYIEGSDPVLKNEYIIFTSHIDHLGVRADGQVTIGADDDASGCAALLEMAQAFLSLPKKPLRSIIFLWVSGEEIGFLGSQWYTNHPLFPLDKTIADLNMDMIGRVKTEADTSKDNPMTGPNSVFALIDNQSKELDKIADEVAKKNNLTLDYSLSARTHPLRLYARSDHYIFVQRDIPTLFFTSGLHATYHTPGDVIEKIDFNNLELITRTMYEICSIIANRKTRIVVDNPFSKWTKL